MSPSVCSLGMGVEEVAATLKRFLDDSQVGKALVEKV